MFTDQEIDYLLEDLGGKEVTRTKELPGGGEEVFTAPGVFEIADESVGVAGLAGRKTLLIRTGALDDPSEGTLIEIDGEGAFLVQYPMRERDGALTRLVLTEP